MPNPKIQSIGERFLRPGLFSDERTRKAKRDNLFRQAVEAENAGDDERALGLYRQILEADPDAPTVYVNMGSIWFKRNQFAVAQAYYHQALDLDPQCALAHYDLSLLLYERSLWLAAIEHCLQALASLPEYGAAHYNLALAYRAVGEDWKAMKHFRLYLRFRTHPNEEYSAQAREAIRELRARCVSSA